MRPVLIDGAMGEGGGQILRTALAISTVTGIPVKIINIRMKRKNPGLRPQHLTAVKALATISSANVKGATIGSTILEFYPHNVKGGNYEFNIGTAGSVSLVLQALLPALAFADKPVFLRLTGGTDVPMAPTIDYMKEVLVRLLNKFGYNIFIDVKRRGHYPKGGGIVEVRIPDPPGELKQIKIINRGKLRGVYGRSHAVKLPRHVAERQAKSAGRIILSRLGTNLECEIEWYEPKRDPHLGPGSGITLWAVYDNSVLGADALGKKGKPAERVGEEAAFKLLEDIEIGAAIDRHASDMLPVYMALARGDSEFVGARLTSHAKTIIELLKIIINNINIEVKGESPFRIRIKGIGLQRYFKS